MYATPPLGSELPCPVPQTTAQLQGCCSHTQSHECRMQPCCLQLAQLSTAVLPVQASAQPMLPWVPGSQFFSFPFTCSATSTWIVGGTSNLSSPPHPCPDPHPTPYTQTDQTLVPTGESGSPTQASLSPWYVHL
jgi:hypothetical protein